MLTIYWSSVVIGLVFGIALGVSVALWAAWKVENETNAKNGSDFANGFHTGWQSGIEHQKLVSKEEVINND